MSFTLSEMKSDFSFYQFHQTPTWFTDFENLMEVKN